MTWFLSLVFSVMPGLIGHPGFVSYAGFRMRVTLFVMPGNKDWILD